MGEVITKLRIDTDEYQNRVRRASTSLNDMAHQCEVAGNKIAVFNTKNVQLARSLGSMQTASTTLRGKVSELSEAFVAAGHTYNGLTQAERNSPFGRELSQSMEQLKIRIRETKSELAGLEGQLGGGSKVGFGAQFAKGLVPGFGMGAGAVGAMAAVKGIQMLTDVTMDAVRINMEFEQSNANLAAVLGTTRDNIGALTDNAKKLGATTLFTANQITELQTVLARRGFSEDQILQMTHGISNLAIATGTNLADAAELAGSTMQAFGMKATDMERIVSVLGVSTTKSALTTEKLGTSIQYVAPAATAAGYSLEEVVSMLGVLVDAGIDASTAGTALRQIIMSMSTENGKMAKSFGRPIRGMEDFIQAISNVKDAEDMLSDASKEVRVTAVPALIALANNKDRIMELKEQITDVGDALQKMADEQASTLQGSVTLLRSAWDGLMISFSESNGTLKELTDNLTNVVSWMTKFRSMAAGGQTAVNALLYDDDDITKKAKEFIQAQLAAGMSNEDILKLARNSGNASSAYASVLLDEANAGRDKMNSTFDKWYIPKPLQFALNSGLRFAEGLTGSATYQGVADAQNNAAMFERVMQILQQKTATNNSNNGNGGGDDNGGGGGGGKSGGSKKAGKAHGFNVWDMPALGSIADLENQKTMVQNSMKMMSDPAEYAEAQKHLDEIQKQIDAIKKGAEEAFAPGSLEWLNKLLKEAQENMKKLVYGTEEWYAAQVEIKDLQAAINVAQGKGVKTTDESTESVKVMKTNWKDATHAVAAVGSALQQVEDPAAKVSGMVAQAIASIAMGFATATAADSKYGVIPWIAASATGLATMISTIAAIKKATEYHAEGGFIGGPKGTDIVPMWGTPGELVLNRAQQGALASQLMGAGMQHVVVTGRISGKDILLAADNTNRSRGGSRGYYANTH